MTVKSAIISQLNRDNSNEAYKTALTTAIPAARDIVSNYPVGMPKFAHSFNTGIAEFRKFDGDKIAHDTTLGTIAGEVEDQYILERASVKDVMSMEVGRFLEIGAYVGFQVAVLQDKILANWINDAMSAAPTSAALNYDGATTFGPRTIKGTTYNNKSDLKLSTVNLQHLLQQLSKFPNAEGTPLRSRGTHLVVSTDLLWQAYELFENQFDASGASNIFYNRPLTIIENPYLNDGIYGVVDSSTAKPFTYYTYGPTDQLDILDNPTDTNVWKHQEVLWHVHARVAVRPAPWSKMLFSDSTDNS